MAIRFQCDCGQTITARDEFAGRKVQCVGCKKVHVVPGQKLAASAALPAPKPPPLQPKPLAADPAPPAEPRTALPPTLAPQPELEEMAPLIAMPAGDDALLQAAAPAPRPAPARSSLLRFRCACGSEFQAKPEYAGEPTRCTCCGEVLFIPERGTAARTDGRPVKAAFDRDDRYRPYREPGSPLAGFLIVLVVLLLMGGGVFAYWEFYLKDYKPKASTAELRLPPGFPGPGGMGGGGGMMGGPPGGGMMGGGRPGGGMMGGGRPGGGMMGGGAIGQPPQEKLEIIRAGETEQTQAFDLVPGDALGFYAYRVADAFNHPDNLKLMAQLGKEASAPMEQIEQMLGFKLTDIERAVVVLPDTNFETAWAVFEASKPFPREKLLALAQASKHVMHKAGAAERAYYPAGPNGVAALHFVNDRLLVAGMKAGVERYLKEGQKRSGPLDGMLKLAAGKRLGVAGLAPPPAVTRDLLDKLPPQLAPFKQALGFKKLQLASAEGSIATSIIDAEYADAKEAEAVRGTLEAQLAAVREELPKWSLPPEAAEFVGSMLKGIKISQTQAAVRVEMTVDLVKAGLLLPAIQKVREPAGK